MARFLSCSVADLAEVVNVACWLVLVEERLLGPAEGVLLVRLIESCCFVKGLLWKY